MIKKTINYETFDGDDVTEDFYFNLSEGELVEMELSGKGNSLRDHVERILKAEHGEEIIQVAKQFILMSYGEKTPDGRGFRKSKEIFESFAGTNAYSKLVLELYSDQEKLQEFFNGIAGASAKKAADHVEGNTETASQAARRRSEEMLQGRKQAATAPAPTGMLTMVEPSIDNIVLETPEEAAWKASQVDGGVQLTPQPIESDSIREKPKPSSDDIAEFLKQNPGFVPNN